VTSLGFVEYFDSVKVAIVEMLTENDATEWAGTKRTQTLEIFKAASVLHARLTMQNYVMLHNTICSPVK